MVSASFLACESAPKRPVGTLKAINAQSATPYSLNFNLETDFDATLALLPDAKGVRVPVQLIDLNKHWCMDAATKEDLVRYALQWKDRYKLLLKRYNECRP